MRRIDGWLSSELGESGDLAPFVSALVEYQDERLRVDFLIDTGADLTTLMPREAYSLLGDPYFNLDFEGAPESRLFEGVGGPGDHYLPLMVTLTFQDDVDVDISLDLEIWLARPYPDYPSSAGNWELPSLLGRDAIQPGDFELSYINGTVTLIRPDGS